MYVCVTSPRLRQIGRGDLLAAGSVMMSGVLCPFEAYWRRPPHSTRAGTTGDGLEHQDQLARMAFFGEAATRAEEGKLCDVVMVDLIRVPTPPPAELGVDGEGSNAAAAAAAEAAAAAAAAAGGDDDLAGDIALSDLDSDMDSDDGLDLDTLLGGGNGPSE